MCTSPLARSELQLLLVRLCAGLAFLPAAVPKLFEGVEARAELAQRLAQLGIPHALQIVVLAGLIELALCFMLTLGYCTRSVGLVSALYLLASTMYLGTWQHALLWMLVCASFIVAGGGRWSIDGWLKAEPMPRKTRTAA
jgi:putative oxidoreductase